MKHTRRCVQRLRPQALQNPQDSPKRGGLHSSGAVAAEYVYDPYGGIAEQGGPLSAVFTFGFSTKPLDRETGLVGYQRRFYKPAIGRWLNRDPIEEEGGENMYVFVHNAPARYWDILGTNYSSIEMEVAKKYDGRTERDTPRPSMLRHCENSCNQRLEFQSIF